jgi:hypothetical protein
MNNEKQLQDELPVQLLMYCYQFSLTIFDFSSMNFPSLYFWDAS